MKLRVPGRTPDPRPWLAAVARRPHPAREVLLATFAVFLLATLVSGWTSDTSVAGIGFAAGAIMAAGTVRRDDLLVLAVAPPAVFLAALLGAALISGWLGGAALTVGSVSASTLLTLSAAAPWLYGGFAAALIVTFARGLRRRFQDLRSALAGLPAPARSFTRTGTSGTVRPAASDRSPQAPGATRAARRR